MRDCFKPSAADATRWWDEAPHEMGRKKRVTLSHLFYGDAFLLCAAPALVFLFARRGRSFLALILGLNAILAVITVLLSPVNLRFSALTCVLWDFSASLWASSEREKGCKEDLDLKANFQGLLQKSAEISEELGRLKIENLKIEKDQKRTLALYGAVKSLAQALSWEDTKPILESAVDQYLGASGYSFYVTSSREPSQLDSLLCRGLHASPGASWAALSRRLEEGSLSLKQSHFIKTPEEAAVAPIEDRGEALGLFYAKIPHGFEGEYFLRQAKTFVAEIAFAFRRLRLFQDVENLSRIDGLTGVHRRGEFEDRLRHEIVRARTFKTTVGLLMLDIDHFKSLNDRYGHPFGDQVLRRVGEILNASVYETDFVARYGGEEFVVILPRAEPAGALRKAESIRQAIENERLTIAFEAVTTSVSIGLAHFPRDASDPQDLIAQADRALYEAKGRGRNQVLDIERVKSGK